jgi:Holliday junction resolvase RusA-like endonuclease
MPRTKISRSLRTSNFTLDLPGPLVGAVRVTQMSKWVNPAYKRYLAFKIRIREEADRVGVPEILLHHAEVSVEMEVHWRLRARCDLDNLIKSLLDGTWKNDRRVLRISASAVEQTGLERLVVRIKVTQ